MTNLSRRGFVAASAAMAAMAPIPAFAAKTVRIGYQRYGNLVLLKASGLLEKRLGSSGWAVDWKLFVSGPPLLEALAAGAIDYGTTGETPPIFSQAAGSPLLYYGAEPPAPRGEAILVLKDSPIKTLADLKGRKLAVTKGANVHYLFVRALEKAGLTTKDVTPVYLAPADGRAAFEHGSVDAWAIWDPFFAAAEASGHARVLIDGTGLVSNHQFYLGSRRFTDKSVLDTIREAIVEIDTTTVKDPAAAAKTLSPEIGLPESVIASALARQSWAIKPIDAKLVADQQVIADTFFKLGLIPKTIKVADAVPSAA